MTRRILSINTASLSPLQVGERSVLTGIRKRSVSAPEQPVRIAVRPLGLEGDEQSDLTVHGGLNKAVYAYPHEHYAFWQTVRSQAGAQSWDEALPFGQLGENLTLTGLLEADAYIGDRLQFPDCVLAISEPRRPCYKFDAVMGFKQASKMMAQSGYCGFYLSVIQPGTLAAGESFDIVPGARDISIRELFLAKMRKGA